MPKAIYNITVEAEVGDSNENLLKVAAREIIAGITLGTDGNLNIEDLRVTAIESSVTVTTKTDCMPDEEINSL